jgi:hypothetical protein
MNSLRAAIHERCPMSINNVNKNNEVKKITAEKIVEQQKKTFDICHSDEKECEKQVQILRKMVKEYYNQ